MERIMDDDPETAIIETYRKNRKPEDWANLILDCLYSFSIKGKIDIDLFRKRFLPAVRELRGFNGVKSLTFSLHKFLRWNHLLDVLYVKKHDNTLTDEQAEELFNVGINKKDGHINPDASIVKKDGSSIYIKDIIYPGAQHGTLPDDTNTNVVVDLNIQDMFELIKIKIKNSSNEELSHGTYKYDLNQRNEDKLRVDIYNMFAKKEEDPLYKNTTSGRGPPGRGGKQKRRRKSKAKKSRRKSTKQRKNKKRKTRRRSS